MNFFCLKFKSRQQIGAREFIEINCLPTEEKGERRVTKNI